MRLWHYLRHKIDPIWPVMPEASYRVAGRTLVLRPVKRGDIATMAELLATAFAEERVAAQSDTIVWVVPTKFHPRFRHRR